MNFLLEAAEVFKKANAEGEKWEQNNPESPKEAEGQPKENIVEGEQLSDKTPEDPIAEQGTLVIYDSEVKASKKKTSLETDDEPPKKKLKFLIPTPTPLSSILPNPPRDQRKGKEIANEDEQMKQLVPLMDQSGSDPKALNLQQFSAHGEKMILEEAQEQMRAMKRLADLKAAEEKSEKSL
ncbi:hypothetical protein Tco_0694081 [Tanacetum coccineum]